MQMPNLEGTIEEGKKRAKKTIDIELHGVWGKGVLSPLTPEVFTPSGWPASATPVLRTLAGKPGAAKRALEEMDGATAASSNEGVGLSHGDTGDSALGLSYLSILITPWGGLAL